MIIKLLNYDGDPDIKQLNSMCLFRLYHIDKNGDYLLGREL